MILLGKLGLLPLYYAQKGDDIAVELHKLTDTSYVLCGEGLWMLKKAEYFWSFQQVKVPNSVEKITPLIHTGGLPKVPKEEMDTAISFFREIYRLHYSEAALILYWHPDSGEFKWTCPKQTVTSASVNYIAADHPGDGWLALLHMHSHAAMSAFHSGTDDKDEQYVDGYNITIGKLNTATYEFETRIMIGGIQRKATMEEIVEGWHGPDAAFPKEWLNQVTKHNYNYTSGGYTAPPAGGKYPGQHDYHPEGPHGDWKAQTGNDHPAPFKEAHSQQHWNKDLHNTKGGNSGKTIIVAGNKGETKREKRERRRGIRQEQAAGHMSDMHPLSGPSKKTGDEDTEIMDSERFLGGKSTAPSQISFADEDVVFSSEETTEAGEVENTLQGVYLLKEHGGSI